MPVVKSARSGSGSTGFPSQTPLVQASFSVDSSLSSHGVPSSFAGSEHRPVPVSHVPASWHWSSAVHTTGFVPTHVPLPLHGSVCVQASLSAHGAPLAFAGFEHTPVPVSHVPASWHWSSAVHTTGFMPTHVPLPLH